MLVGYMQVSSDSDRQTTDLQRDALLSAGVDSRHLFEDHAQRWRRVSRWGFGADPKHGLSLDLKARGLMAHEFLGLPGMKYLRGAQLGPEARDRQRRCAGRAWSHVARRDPLVGAAEVSGAMLGQSEDLQIYSYKWYRSPSHQVEKYAMPSRASAQAKRIYRSVSLSWNESPFRLRVVVKPSAFASVYEGETTGF